VVHTTQLHSERKSFFESDSMATDASLADLETRLVTFTEQLQSIHELLQSEPTNAEFLGIAKDLVEVIQLTKETVRALPSLIPPRSLLILRNCAL
jgi:hypothetical protein